MLKVESQFERLEAVYKHLGKDLNRQPPATRLQIDSIATITGVEVDDHLKSLWSISNGSGSTKWFAEGEDEFVPYYFLSVDEVLENWLAFAPYDASIYQEWYDDEEWGGARPSNPKAFSSPSALGALRGAQWWKLSFAI